MERTECATNGGGQRVQETLLRQVQRRNFSQTLAEFQSLVPGTRFVRGSRLMGLIRALSAHMWPFARVKWHRHKLIPPTDDLSGTKRLPRGAEPVGMGVRGSGPGQESPNQRNII